MRSQLPTIITVISLSVIALGGVSGCRGGTESANELPPVTDTRVAIFDAMAKSESASGRAECFLRMSGKNTDELQRLHELLLSRNLQVARSLREPRQLSPEELARLEKLRTDILIGTEEVEKQVSLTVASMSATQLQQARAVCQTKG
jgi:cob(I)alamin adenosyltransferase